MMDDVQVAVTTPVPVSSLRRRNSIRTSLLVPTKFTLPSTSSSSSSSSSSNQSFPSDDFEFISIKPFSYTSIRDLLPSPAAVNSPTTTTSSATGGHEISIRNRLVKQAAWAYLQPISTSTESQGRSFIHRAWTRLSALFRSMTRAFDWLFRAIPVKISSKR